MSQPLTVLLHDLAQQKMTNCVFSFRNKDGKKTKLAAHQLILSAISPVFNEIFFGPLAQKSSAEIEIVGITHRGFEKLVWVIYGKAFTIENSDEAFELYEAAEKYGVSSARKIARDYMIRTNDISTASLYFKAGLMFKDPSLETASKDIFKTEVDHENGVEVEDDSIADMSNALQPFKDAIANEVNLNVRISKTLQIIRFCTTEAGHLFATIISTPVARFDCSLNYVPRTGTFEELQKHMTNYLNCVKYKDATGFLNFAAANGCNCKTHRRGKLASALVPKLMKQYLTGNLAKYTLKDVQAIDEEFNAFLLPQPKIEHNNISTEGYLKSVVPTFGPPATKPLIFSFGPVTKPK